MRDFSRPNRLPGAGLLPPGCGGVEPWGGHMGVGGWGTSGFGTEGFGISGLRLRSGFVGRWGKEAGQAPYPLYRYNARKPGVGLPQVVIYPNQKARYSPFQFPASCLFWAKLRRHREEECGESWSAPRLVSLLSTKAWSAYPRESILCAAYSRRFRNRQSHIVLSPQTLSPKPHPNSGPRNPKA